MKYLIYCEVDRDYRRRNLIKRVVTNHGVIGKINPTIWFHSTTPPSHFRSISFRATRLNQAVSHSFLLEDIAAAFD